MNVTDRRSPTYVAVLAVVAGLILAAGWLLRPRDIPQSPPSVPSETELQELARRAQRRSLESATAYFSELAANVRPALGYIPSMHSSGIVWDDSHIVTGPVRGPDGRAALTVRLAAGERHSEATSSGRLPLSVLEISLGPRARMPRRATSVPPTGDWVVAVWQTDDAPAFASGNFRQAVSTSCGIAPVKELTAGIPLTRAMVGGGLFSMDRELLAVILPCGDHTAAIAPASIDDMLERLTSIQERLLARYGALVSSFSAQERQYFSDTDGLLVREVWTGTRADAAGLQAGDVVIAVNGRAVGTIDDLRPLMAPTAVAFEVNVRRGSKTQTVVVDSSAATPNVSPENGADAGFVIESSTSTFRIAAVLPDSRAARAGVKAGDVLRRINHVEPRTRAQLDRVVKAGTSKPILVEIEREQRRLAIVIP